MKTLIDYLNEITDLDQRARMESVFDWVKTTYPQLESTIKWNQPMFTDHGTFIIGFSRAKHHMSFTPEEYTMNHFMNDIKEAGYDYTKGLVKIKWTEDIQFDLISKMIAFNLDDKVNCTTFFR